MSEKYDMMMIKISGASPGVCLSDLKKMFRIFVFEYIFDVGKEGGF